MYVYYNRADPTRRDGKNSIPPVPDPMGNTGRYICLLFFFQKIFTTKSTGTTTRLVHRLVPTYLSDPV